MQPTTTTTTTSCISPPPKTHTKQQKQQQDEEEAQQKQQQDQVTSLLHAQLLHEQEAQITRLRVELQEAQTLAAQLQLTSTNLRSELEAQYAGSIASLRGKVETLETALSAAAAATTTTTAAVKATATTASPSKQEYHHSPHQRQKSLSEVIRERDQLLHETIPQLESKIVILESQRNDMEADVRLVREFQENAIARSKEATRRAVEADVERMAAVATASEAESHASALAEANAELRDQIHNLEARNTELRLKLELTAAGVSETQISRMGLSVTKEALSTAAATTTTTTMRVSPHSPPFSSTTTTATTASRSGTSTSSSGVVTSGVFPATPAMPSTTTFSTTATGPALASNTMSKPPFSAIYNNPSQTTQQRPQQQFYHHQDVTIPSVKIGGGFNTNVPHTQRNTVANHKNNNTGNSAPSVTNSNNNLLVIGSPIRSNYKIQLDVLPASTSSASRSEVSLELSPEPVFVPSINRFSIGGTANTSNNAIGNSTGLPPKYSLTPSKNGGGRRK